MRTGTTLYYLLSDHLGSTSLTTDSNGVVVSELRYTPWGEVRYNAGVTPTDYSYTGQYSNTADFGLMFYNARWYDPYLGRMAQADTIIPPGVQGLDHYAYSNNNPVMYVDPNGHNPIPLFLVALEIAVVVGVTAVIYSTPQMQELKDNFISMAKSGLPSWKYRKAQIALSTLNYQADDSNGNGPQLKGCKNSRLCIGLILTGAITAAKVIANKIICNASEDESCNGSQLSTSPSQTHPDPTVPNSTESPKILPPINEALAPLYPPLDIPNPTTEQASPVITPPNDSKPTYSPNLWRIIQQQWQIAQ